MHSIRSWFLLCAVALSLGSVSRAEKIPEPDRLQTLPIANVDIRDPFWAPKIKVYREKTIPHSWFYMQWEMRSLRKAAGQKVEGELNGTWGEANLHKFLETVACSLAMGRDAALVSPQRHTTRDPVEAALSFTLEGGSCSALLVDCAGAAAYPSPLAGEGRDERSESGVGGNGTPLPLPPPQIGRGL